MTKTVTTIQFEAPVQIIENTSIVRLPEQASLQLPSRGQVAVTGTFNGHDFKTVLEPDGYWGHWMRVEETLQKNADVGDVAHIEMQTTKEWPEPVLPKDFERVLSDAPQKVQEKWHDITAMARWEWIRWINSTGNNETRRIRLEKTVSKLNGTHRRPCCFNLAACTDSQLSKSGRFIGGAL